MRQPRKTSAKSNYTMALVLLIILVIIFVFLKRISQHGLPHSMVSALEPATVDYTRIRQFDDSTKNCLKKAFTGFWESIASTSDTCRLATKDRLEFKDNGIIWRVKSYRLQAPDGAISEFYHVMHGYVNPYGRIPADSATIVCEVRIIRQVYVIAQHDTCYGPSAVDELWRARRSDGEFELAGFRYTPYSSTVLDTFFPARMIDLVDDIRVPQCPHTVSFASWARECIWRGLASLARGSDTTAAVRLIKAYYEPIFIADAVRRLGQSGLTPSGSVRVSLRVRADGAVERVSLANIKGPIADTLAAEMKAWRFAPHADASAVAEQIETVVHLRRRL